ncbi:sterol o-acyltransferase [Moniliophthora roreri MCA 2997]|uniref:O-acyltransferase n=1 Tax=Moniliophthora roreri (strain MCA 2997) TaxID=1381753 RepID=V2XVC8_MONRO|nr:sterol o-acyltransferase [Moniliophthora roreri MCA 2997]
MPIDNSPPVSNPQSTGFKTSDGTIYVSKTFRSKSAPQNRRALITFVPRQSVFDINNEASTTNQFRGFFSLFWISMFIFMVRTYIRSFEAHGHVLDLHFATMFSRDAITLAISDGVLVGTTVLCVPFAKAISKGWIRYQWTGVLSQHLFQTAVLFSAISWTFNRQWPWVQSGFLTLHSLVLIMKIHSYMAVNGYLSNISQQSQSTLDQLRHVAETLGGGWAQAILDAKRHKVELDKSTGMTSTDSETSVPSQSHLAPPPTTRLQISYVDPETATTLRKRLVALSDANGVVDADAEDVIHDLENDSNKKDDDAGERLSPAAPHPLIDHPNEQIAELAREYTELQGELTSSGPLYVTWPNNITFKNFAVYMLIPTLVYELEYPRTDKIRPLYVFEKTVATFGTFLLLYSVTERFILTQTPTPDQSFLRSLLDLSLPFMLAYLLLFYIIFECICNGFAELSYFADRQFYEDWWNSTSWDEFSRKWNRPVHMFLLRHVYQSTMASYKISKNSAMFVTFLLSACMHELVMAIVTKKFRFYLFAMQLIQIPLITISRIPAIKRNKMLGNLVFWLGLYAGFPLLCVAYVAY